MPTATRLALLGALVLLSGKPVYAQDEGIGVSLEFANLNTDWEFSDDTREARTNSLIVKIEERTDSGLSVGGGVGYHWLSLDDSRGNGSTKFDVQNLLIYLRQDFTLSESVIPYVKGNFAWYTGDDNDSDESIDIDWSQVGVEIGSSFRFGKLGVTPLLSYTDVDGDTSGLEDGGSFELDDNFGQGLRFEYFVESSGYISLEFRTGSQTGGYLSFGGRY